MSSDESVSAVILKYIGSSSDVLKVSFSGVLREIRNPWIRVTLRPILIKGEEYVQFSFYDEKKCIVKNYRGPEYVTALNDLIALSFKNIFIESTKGTLQIQVSKKGKLLVNESSKVKAKEEVDLKHNRTKQYILPEDVPSDFLEAVGIMTKDGKVKADKQHKFRQLNGFLKIIDETLTKADKVLELKKGELLAIDCGCGNAYLTFAVYNYFNYILKRPLKLVGVDSNKPLLERHLQQIEKLEWDKLQFEGVKISEYVPSQNPDIVLALHACNTATDDALFQAVTWESKMVFASPCCHHNLQVQLEKEQENLTVFAPLFRYGVLSERLGDIITDSFRALILRIMGYQTDVIEFVSTDHTNRNLIIRAIKCLEPGDKKFVEEYKALKVLWHVTPYLEELLGERLTQYL